MSGTTMGVKVDQETRERLKRVSEMKDRSVHWLMKEAICRYLETEERFEQEKAEDRARYQAYLDTGRHISNDEMMSWLDELAQKAGKSPTE
jgi:predicted transcriptional regulator